jgi:hypothetical protein
MAEAVSWDVITEQGVLLVAKYREDKKPAPVAGEGLKIAAFDLVCSLSFTSLHTSFQKYTNTNLRTQL